MKRWAYLCCRNLFPVMIAEKIQRQHAGTAVEPLAAGTPGGHLSPDMENA